MRCLAAAIGLICGRPASSKELLFAMGCNPRPERLWGVFRLPVVLSSCFVKVNLSSELYENSKKILKYLGWLVGYFLVNPKVVSGRYTSHTIAPTKDIELNFI
jgi:hypothetical protein